ncbi:hypothetical protein [Moorena sp. SIO4G3]|uniref:hypothetical protein n=1 Tax=Moorena sp. SIO4G3 TaxID=2607821 RepID=UPI001429BDC7|nr:hypothetical protein [Moorena sp. SIO4G3]NEO75815.1 hypothetical protein [Moorena sp. SIO4G3]
MASVEVTVTMVTILSDLIIECFMVILIKDINMVDLSMSVLLNYLCSYIIIRRVNQLSVQNLVFKTDFAGTPSSG